MSATESKDGDGASASNTSSTDTQQQEQSQGFQPLPLLKKHYKTTLFILLGWVAGYLGFSSIWVLIGFFFHVVNEEYRTAKDAQKSLASDATKNEEAALLARVNELPAWVNFPDVERAEWLNKMIRQIWPHIGDYVKKLLKETVQPTVDGSLPELFKPFTFENIDLGNTPPRIGGVKVYADNVHRDEFILDLEIIYAGDAEVNVAVRGMNAGIKDLTLHGTLRVFFKPLVPIVPMIGGMNVFFLDKPEVHRDTSGVRASTFLQQYELISNSSSRWPYYKSIDFDLTNIANILDIPGLSNKLRSVIQDLIANYCVMPNKIPIQLVNSIDITALKFPIPQGVLRLHVVAARDLKADGILFGKSDPYCKIYVVNKVFQTNTIKSNCNPVWNKYYEVAVDQMHGQVIELEVFDEDMVKDDELGTASIGIEKIANHGSMDSWLPLENVTTGMVHIRAFWFNLSNDSADLDRTGKTLPDVSPCPRSEDHLSTSLLIVNVDSAKNLPRDRKTMSEPSSYVNIEVGDDKQKSIVKTKTTDPRWESNFQFMVHDPHGQELNVVVVDSDNGDRKLGHINYPIKNLLIAKDLTVQRPFELSGSSPNARVTLRLSLRIMTSKTPENAPAEEKRDK